MHFAQSVSETLHQWQETIQSQDGIIKSISLQQERLANEVITSVQQNIGQMNQEIAQLKQVVGSNNKSGNGGGRCGDDGDVEDDAKTRRIDILKVLEWVTREMGGKLWRGDTSILTLDLITKAIQNLELGASLVQWMEMVGVPLDWVGVTIESVKFGNLPVLKQLKQSNRLQDLNEKKIVAGSDGTKLIHLAAKANQWNVLKWMVEECGARLEEKDEETGESVIHIASSCGHLEMLKLLESRFGFDLLQERDKLGRTLIHSAASNGHLDILKWIWKEKQNQIRAKTLHSLFEEADKCERLAWKEGSSENTKSTLGMTPAEYAAKNGHLMVLRWMKEECEIDILKKVNPSPSMSSTSSPSPSFGGRASIVAHLAACYGHTHILEWLFDSLRLNVNMEDEQGRTMIHYAAWGRDNPEMMLKWLVNDRHAYVRAVDKQGRNLLNYLLSDATTVCSSSSSSIVVPIQETGLLSTLQWLRNDCGFNMDVAVGPDGMKPFHLAVLGGHLSILKWLKNDCDFNMYAADKDGSTPAQYAAQFAAQNGHLPILRWLSICCANWILQNGLHLADLAARNGHLSVLQWLNDCRVPLFALNNDGGTLAHVAATNGHLHILKWLKNDCGFNMYAADKIGWTPAQNAIQFATQNGNLPMLRWLKEDCGINICGYE